MSQIPMFPNKFAILASILGALCYKGTANNTMDANALPNGYWSCYNENRPTNTPYIGNGGIICFRADDVVLQIAFDKNTQKTFYRMEAYDAWTAWHEYTYDMPSFYKDYANLSSLASALGVPAKAIEVEYGSTVDNVLNNGFYDITQTADNPYTKGNTAFMIVIATSNYALQLAFRSGEADKRRWYWINGWTQWS